MSVLPQVPHDLPKTVVCIVVYNRLHHLKHWLKCWEHCVQVGAQLVVIQNHDADSPSYQELCEEYGALYLARPNVGFDIGAFQDVCADRLLGFPAWERLLWLTDDTFPMRPTFLQEFHEAMVPGVGIACMEVSPYVSRHVRTTGFMVDRAVAERLTFPVDRIVTKQQCYLFEHRGRKKTLYNQVKAMGLDCVMVASRERSPAWDIGYHRRLDRLAEHEQVFGKLELPNRILVICPVFRNYPQIVSSMLTQTHQNWDLFLVHDGPDLQGIKHLVPNDPRIHWTETPKFGGCWGHYIRQACVAHFCDPRDTDNDFDFVVITNADNYHTPVFLEYLYRGFEQNPAAVAVYCAQMVHSYKAWQVIDCRLEQGFIDCAGVMVRAAAAHEVGWNDITTHSADWTYFSDLIVKFGAHRFHKVAGCLLTHN